jgi:hypothetical protein
VIPKNDSAMLRSAAGSPSMTPEQRRRNKTSGLVLLVIVVAIFAWAMLKGGRLFLAG